MSLQANKLITAEEFVDMVDAGRSELIRGEVVSMAPPPGAEHGDVVSELAFQITGYVKLKKLGKIFAAETGFIVAKNPDTVRAADIGFVRGDRIPLGRLRGYINGSPDLVAEVILPSDRIFEVLEKVDEWLAGGAVSVWLVDPQRRSIDIYRQSNQITRYHENDEIDNEPALPGFSMLVKSIFDSSL